MENIVLKRIVLDIPYDSEINNLDSFSPEEKYIILKTGIDCLQLNRLMLENASNSDIYERIKQDFLSQVEKSECKIKEMEKEILIEKEIMRKYKEEEDDRLKVEIEKAMEYKQSSYDLLTASKDISINNLNEVLLTREKEMIKMKEEMRQHELEMSNIIEKNVNEQLKVEREKNALVMRDVLEKNMSLLENINLNKATKTSTEIGIQGEKIFGEIAEETFKDFEGFELLDVHKQTHKGDWHISIKELTIMVDSKSYKRKVDITQREKIKNDLKKNEHIHFAWLVSLNTNIDKRDNGIFVFEWISEKQCIVHINNLLSLEEPKNILKTIYYLCKENYSRIINSEMTTQEITRMREDHHILKDKVGTLRKRVKEIKGTINGLKNLHDGLEDDIINLLNSESNNFMNKYYNLVVDWWSKSLILKNDSKLKSTAIWTKFKKDNEEIVKEMDVNTFKEILCVFLPENDIIKPKNKMGALEINNIGWKESDIVIKTEEIIS